ncbi:MAG: hypothetical protein DRI97_02260 [Bacteroidetes bacterium]|nr:MAG: hypothetical protein DRI97_02260 [Bacteroidota bacterium]RLD95918.1 MAG: hypothetical protein DRJ29_01490 [Bacteroidota bacterium]
MKIYIPFWILSIAASLILSTGLLAQEQIEMSIKVTKDGKVVKDTSYQFDDAAEAKNAMKMMELMSGDELHKEHVTYNYTTAHSGHGEAKTMVFISKDGETTEISELHGDSLVWVTEEEHDGKKVIVMKSGDVVKKKEIKVMVSSDEEGNWTVVEGDEKMMDKDENVFIMKGDDDVKVKVMKIMEEEGDGENVKVIVITESGDLHEDHDVDHDHDSDHGEEVEVEVKVVKKKEKK